MAGGVCRHAHYCDSCGMMMRCPAVCRLYRQLGGGKWVWNAITSSLVFPLPLLGVFSVVNTIAISQVSRRQKKLELENLSLPASLTHHMLQVMCRRNACSGFLSVEE